MIDFPVKDGLYQVEVVNLAGCNNSGQMLSVRYPLFLLGYVGSEQFLMLSSKNGPFKSDVQPVLLVRISEIYRQKGRSDNILNLLGTNHTHYLIVIKSQPCSLS